MQRSTRAVPIMWNAEDTYREPEPSGRALSTDPLSTRLAPPSRALLARCNRALSALKPGTRVGEYAVTAKLHEGRFSATYAAIQARRGDPVVVRVLDLEQRHNPLARACLRRAAKIADLIGPNAAPRILHRSTDSLGRGYVVSELRIGQALGTAMKRRIQRVTALEWLSAAAEMLSRVHGAGVLHRDLTPEHIFLDRGGRAMALGLSLAAGPIGEHLPPEFANPRLFHPRYKAPEFARSLVASGKSDIYSLGVIAYELVTGQLPFPAGSNADSSRCRPPSDLWPSIPRPLAMFLARALSADPATRPTLTETMRLLRASASAVAADPGERATSPGDGGARR